MKGASSPMAALTVETPKDAMAFTEFLQFRDKVYASREAYWPASIRFELQVLQGHTAFNEGRTLQPFEVRSGRSIVARVLAVIDARYQQHWQEKLGHLWWFEALPENREAVRLLMDEACAWLATHGAEAARAGSGALEFPFVIDAYNALPPNILRQNPPYYHALIKGAGFESEKGWVDYKIEVRPELVHRWASMVEAAQRAGYDIVPVCDIPPDRRVTEFTATFNETFHSHWGWIPYTENEMASLFTALESFGTLDASVLAYHNGQPVGMLLLTPEHSKHAVLAPGRVLRPDEKLNVLAIGVKQQARGRGVNLAMAGYGLLELVRRGAQYVSYTLVFDDNWPSRRTGEKLGGSVCANYMVYRRNFSR
jgi:predicted GNAT family acetyltransferase